MKGKKDSYLGDVGIIKKIDDLPELKEKLIEEFDKKSDDHKAISQYSLLLADHVLELTGIPRDNAMEEVFVINQEWQAGNATFQEARQVAFQINRLAKEEKDPVKERVLRVMGQVAATPHVKRHALIASDYAITLINRMYPKNFEEVQKEREKQIELMKRVTSALQKN